jgi:hypothetical protein
MLSYVYVCADAVITTWEVRSGHLFWSALLKMPLGTHGAMCFKAMIIVHKLLHDGHPSVCRLAFPTFPPQSVVGHVAIKLAQLLDSCSVTVAIAANALWRLGRAAACLADSHG